MYKGQEIVNLAEKQLGTRGSAAKAYCGLPGGANYCDAFVSWLFYKEGERELQGTLEGGWKESVVCKDKI